MWNPETRIPWPITAFTRTLPTPLSGLASPVTYPGTLPTFDLEYSRQIAREYADAQSTDEFFVSCSDAFPIDCFFHCTTGRHSGFEGQEILNLYEPSAAISG